MHEIITIAVYRELHAQYKFDYGSKALHRNAPMVAVWDDHEFSNDTWKKGAENHAIDGSEGDFYARRSAAIKAYHEWMPIREQQNKRKFFLNLKFGNLINLFFLITVNMKIINQFKPGFNLVTSELNQESFSTYLAPLEGNL